MKVTILRGLPGSGKSTWVAKNYPEAKVLSTDNYYMVDGEYKFDPSRLATYHAALLRDFVQLCLDGTASHVCIDNTNVEVWQFAPYYQLAVAYGHTVEVVEFYVPPEVCVARNKHGVPSSTVQRMFDRWQWCPLQWNVRTAT